jgi:hypothetical protein
MSELTPGHGSRQVSDGLHPEVTAAYKYVDSVLSTADAQSPMGGHAWHGWALREAFLAGCTHALAQLPAADVERPRPLLREDEGFTCLIKRLLHDVAEAQP